MDENLQHVTDAMLRSYATEGGINHVDGTNLPSKRTIAEICEDLLQLLFPGFHDVDPIHSQDLPPLTSQRVGNISERMTDEICKSLRLQAPKCQREEAATQAHHFIGGLPRVRELLATDVEAAFTGDPAAGGTKSS
jgi:serine O-acetyltransferase